jgi:hypothetical protein
MTMESLSFRCCFGFVDHQIDPSLGPWFETKDGSNRCCETCAITKTHDVYGRDPAGEGFACLGLEFVKKFPSEEQIRAGRDARDREQARRTRPFYQIIWWCYSDRGRAIDWTPVPFYLPEEDLLRSGVLPWLSLLECCTNRNERGHRVMLRRLGTLYTEERRTLPEDGYIRKSFLVAEYLGLQSCLDGK